MLLESNSVKQGVINNKASIGLRCARTKEYKQLWPQRGTGVPQSKTLSVQGIRPNNRQVLECVRDSAAFPLAPVNLPAP